MPSYRLQELFHDLHEGIPAFATDELTGTYVGDVRAVSNGEVIASIDPDATATPVSDARDAIVTDGDGRGTILYPPREITEESAYTQSEIGISHRGYGVGTSTVVFPAGTADGYVWDGVSRVEFGGITVSGGDGTRAAGSAWRFINSATDDFNVGAVQFRNWAGADPVIHCDTGHPYSGDWRKLRAGTTNEGPFLLAEDSFGPGMSVENIRASLGTQDPAVQIAASGGGFVTDVGATFERINVGGSTTQALITQTSNGQIKVGGIDKFGADTDAVVKVLGGTVPVVESVRLAGSVTVDNIYQLGGTGNTVGRGSLALPDDSGTVNSTQVAVNDDTNRRIIFEGVSNQVTNNTGAALSQPISCLADLTTVT